MKIATWNVNSIRSRMEHVLAWLKANKPDVLCIQETKVVNELFPKEPLEKLGYQIAFEGQKAYNGVAIISKHPIKNVKLNLIKKEFSEQKRLIQANIKGIQIINVYVPNGFELESDKYKFKMNWLNDLKKLLKKQLKEHKKMLICGDFNIAPAVGDVYEGREKRGGIHLSPEEREKLSTLTEDFTDIWRHFHPTAQEYSWWDYRSGSFPKNNGMRIDMIYVTKELQKICKKAWMDVVPRNLTKPSDHIPVVVELK
jgi:exodeoxyribonuclease III